MYTDIEQYIQSLQVDLDAIVPQRQEVLHSLSQHILHSLQDQQKVELVFICTHNSRRSHLAQIWAQTLASYYAVGNIFTYSGGTEATAFHPHAVKALASCGFQIKKTEDTANPLYKVSFSNEGSEIIAFSKVYNNTANPKQNFTAIMVCDEADEACPIIFGASQRFSISYVDPKKYDGTPKQEAEYAKSCRIIASEMAMVFSQINIES